MRVLITGGSGQLGQSLQAALEDRNIEFLAPSHTQMDITDANMVRSAFEGFLPDVVIHTAAYNNVDLAETQIEQCRAININGTQNIASASDSIGAYLISISTDYVFDGSASAAYQPLDKKSPLQIYGKTKAEGEDVVLRTNCKNLVLRTAWLFGAGRNNFVRSILKNAEVHDNICVVSDQIGCPTYAGDLAGLIMELLKLRPGGILHGTNTGACSRAEFAREIIKISGLDCAVQEVKTSEYKRAAARPLYAELSSSCLTDMGISTLPDWKTAIRKYMIRGEYGDRVSTKTEL